MGRKKQRSHWTTQLQEMTARQEKRSGVRGPSTFGYKYVNTMGGWVITTALGEKASDMFIRVRLGIEPEQWRDLINSIPCFQHRGYTYFDNEDLANGFLVMATLTGG